MVKRRIIKLHKKWVFAILGVIIFPVATIFDYILIGRYTLTEYFWLNIFELLIFFFGWSAGESWMYEQMKNRYGLRNKNG